MRELNALEVESVDGGMEAGPDAWTSTDKSCPTSSLWDRFVNGLIDNMPPGGW